MPTTVIVGTDALVGSHLAAHLLARPDHCVYWVLDLERWSNLRDYERLVMDALERADAAPAADGAAAMSRLHVTRLPAIVECSGDAVGDLPRPLDVWVLAGGRPLHASANASGNDDRYREALAAAACHFKPSTVQWVERGSAGRDPESLCRWPQDVRVRSFRVGALVHADLAQSEPPDDLMAVVQAIDDIVQDVRGRLPEYFEWHALKLLASPDAVLSLMPVDDAVRSLLAAAVRNDRSSDLHDVDGGDRVGMSEICGCIGDAYELSLIAAGADRAPGAIDRLLMARLGSDNPLFWAREETASPAAASLLERNGETASRLMTRVAAARDACERARRRRDERVRATEATFDRRSVAVRGGTLTYLAAGTAGPPLVLLNALGQGVGYWFRLIDRLAAQHRVFVWEVRGMAAADPTDLRLADHAADLLAVLRQERVDACCLVGWCNGPQVAVEFYRRWKAPVRGMVFLNPTFNLPQRADLKTPFTEDNESLCHMVATHPELAPSIARTLSAVAEPNVDQLLALEPETLAEVVVRLTSRDLRREVVRPFFTPETTIRYAAQVLDRQSEDTLAHAAGVDVPVLVVGCEHDQVAAAESVRVMCGRFPFGRYVELAGTHHVLHEQAERIADLITTFAGELSDRDSATPAVSPGALSPHQTPYGVG